MRIQGFVDIDQIYYAIIEKNGSLSLLKKDDPMAHAIIIDGQIIEETLVRQEINRKNVEDELSRKGLRLDDVFLMTVSDSGEIKTILKENET
jgi:uncharacterized membrane protein YcaP (DUF421 family)